MEFTNIESEGLYILNDSLSNAEKMKKNKRDGVYYCHKRDIA